MEQKYWERFTQTGRVEDYLYYKGIETCKHIMERYEDKQSESVDRGNGNDTLGIADGRI